MIVKNEESTLERCLSSIVSSVNEVVIVDTGSTDSTKQIALKYGALIFDYQWNGDFAEARNFALSKSTSQWNLVLDADEYISNNCGNVIQQFIKGEPAIGRVKIVDKFMGSDGISFEQNYISRLLPSSCRYMGRIHEQVVSNLPRIIVDVEVQHDGYFQQKKSDRNIPILKQEITDNPNNPYYHYQIAKEYRGLENHEDSYLHLKKAYSLITHKEGYAPSLIVNFMYAIMSSGHLSDGLVVIENEEEFLKSFADFQFVSGLYLLELILSNPDQYGKLLPYIERFYLCAIEIGETGLEGSVIGTGSFAAHHNLGVFYEVVGNIQKAKEQYVKATAYDYKPSLDRLINLG
ncbi:hypothetical protein LPB68_14195 [Paenibacillus crassostreae]|nr:hypothetical protein LPB68_14195 [Paenibacillus crassostreae]